MLVKHVTTSIVKMSHNTDKEFGLSVKISQSNKRFPSGLVVEELFVLQSNYEINQF